MSPSILRPILVASLLSDSLDLANVTSGEYSGAMSIITMRLELTSQ